MQLHHASNAFAVVAGPEGPVHHRPHPAIAVGRPAIRHGPDLLQHRVVIRAVVAAASPRADDVVRRAARDPED